MIRISLVGIGSRAAFRSELIAECFTFVCDTMRATSLGDVLIDGHDLDDRDWVLLVQRLQTVGVYLHRVPQGWIASLSYLAPGCNA